VLFQREAPTIAVLKTPCLSKCLSPILFFFPQPKVFDQMRTLNSYRLLIVPAPEWKERPPRGFPFDCPFPCFFPVTLTGPTAFPGNLFTAPGNLPFFLPHRMVPKTLERFPVSRLFLLACCKFSDSSKYIVSSTTNRFQKSDLFVRPLFPSHFHILNFWVREFQNVHCSIFMGVPPVRH